jgi:hypothetical protein
MASARYLDSQEAADHLGFKSRKAFLNMLSRRRLAGYRMTERRLNGRRRFLLADLEQLVTVVRTGSAQAPAAPERGHRARGASGASRPSSTDGGPVSGGTESRSTGVSA